MEGIVYVCENEKDAVKFPAVHLVKDIIVLPIDVPDDIEIEETFDHAYEFFQCRYFGIKSSVPVDWIDVDNCIQYDLSQILRNY